MTETAKQRAFVEHPDALTNPAKAALDVGYSESFARSGKLYELRDQYLPQLVEKMRARLEGLSITPEWVKNEVAILANTALADFVEHINDKNDNEVVVLKKAKDIDPKKWRAAIKEVELDSVITKEGKLRSRISKIKLYDRQAALVELGHLLGMKNEKLMFALMAPQNTDGDDSRLIEFMTTEELETMAEIQEKAAHRMRKAADKRRDGEAITVQTSEPAGSKQHSATGGPRTRQRQKTRRLPPPPLPPEN